VSPNSQLHFDQLAPPDIQEQLNVCNRTCRQVPTLGLVGKEWVVGCSCCRYPAADMLTALLRWNQFNPIKRMMPAARLPALREIRRKDKEKGLASHS